MNVDLHTIPTSLLTEVGKPPYTNGDSQGNDQP